MTINAPRTRRELRIELQSARNEAAALTEAIRAAGIKCFTEIRAYSDGPTHYCSKITNAVTAQEQDRQTDQAVSSARRETLTAVRDALELKGYTNVDTLWDDIQTALQVRAERADTHRRAKIEEKVAGLRKTQTTTWFGDDLAGGVTPLGFTNIATTTPAKKKGGKK